MLSNLNPSWQTFLSEEIQKDFFLNLMQEVDEEYQNHTCFPSKDLIFSAFNHCALEDVKVVIIGQDPYHGEGEANGLSFSVNDGVKIPPSLRNIYRELTDDLGAIFMPTSGNLKAWAKQGVLLLNATLSVRKDSPNSHKHLAWSRFTDVVIEKLASEKQQLVFLLWGSFAQKKGNKIDRNQHLVLESGHPSPMSANQGKWFGNRHFSQTNTYLISNGLQPIDWL
ncbi:uracil-DNA glycosylase [Flavobacterium polysaccharolyticum]|uniref:Uracil-DNA glycosylase n=1 Tax=Flavobacterium polysaccharolyticum TaxID=3133148 RepID=A0ABU9NQI5_9FLAO